MTKTTSPKWRATYRKNHKDRIKIANRMHLSQKGVCACCSRDVGFSGLDIDHNHKTGKVRALLCRDCNLGLGMFKDDLARVLQAAVYLSKFPQE